VVLRNELRQEVEEDFSFLMQDGVITKVEVSFIGPIFQNIQSMENSI
jgi:hypothetical protein